MDAFPKQICLECLQRLRNTFEFRRMIIASQQLLQETVYRSAFVHEAQRDMTAVITSDDVCNDAKHEIQINSDTITSQPEELYLNSGT